MVADSTMVKHHGQQHIERYVLTIMNMVRLPGGGCGEGFQGMALANCTNGQEGWQAGPKAQAPSRRKSL